ncbi:MAG: molybdopterin molybdotransferase MoeA [Rhizobiales bacterium]|nr:molybdopterin molybdotransferase MoeA [Hyphomicrobiales bacterium]
MNRPRRLIDDCFIHDKDRLRHAEVLKILADRLSPVADIETVDLTIANGRVLAELITAPHDIPGFTNTAVDGYAFAISSLGNGETTLKTAMRVQAGVANKSKLEHGEAARIFTGAVMPDGADTCIMQEDARADDDTVTIPAGVKKGINVRAAGEDVKAGDKVVAVGARLRPPELAAIASTGTARVKTFKPLTVALVSTGDEIIRPGGQIEKGQVYDSNNSLLTGLLETTGAKVTDLGVLPDDRTVVATTIREAASRFDIIVTTGGASRGEADYIVETIQELGSLHAWQIAIKPGRPLAFGQIGDTVFLGLPGNPVAVFVCFLLYAIPVFARLQGASWHEPQRYPLPAGFAMPKLKPDRREFWRGWVDNGNNGPVLRKFARDGSGLISGLTPATGLIEVAEETTAVAEGDVLDFIPFTEFGLPPASR